MKYLLITLLLIGCNNSGTPTTGESLDQLQSDVDTLRMQQAEIGRLIKELDQKLSK